MFKLGEMFVAFTGKDAGLKAMFKAAGQVGKATGKVFETGIKEGAKLTAAGMKTFERISAASVKAAAIVTKSFERIASQGVKAAARITPAFLRSFDRIVGHAAKLSGTVVKTLGSVMNKGIGAAVKGSGGLGGIFKGMSGAVSGFATGVTAAGKSVAGGFMLMKTAAVSAFTYITMGVAAVVAAGAGIAALIGLVTSMAGSAQEMQSKFDVVFGSSAPQATAEISKLATAMGRSHNDLKEMASGVQDLLVPLGFARDKAAGMSVKIAQLAVDMASFGNKTDAEAMEDIQAAMSGSGEVMKKYGVIINEVTMKQELAKMGYKGTTEAASEQLKTIARLNLIIAGTSDAHGDAQRTGGSFANQMKRIMGLLKDIGTNLGRVFLPAAETLAVFFSDNLQLISENSETLEAYGDVVKSWAETAVLWFSRAIAVFLNWSEISKSAFNVVAATARTSLDVIIGMLDNVEIFLLNMFGHLIDFFPNFLSTVAETHGSLWSFLKKGWAEIWAFIKSGGTDAIEMDFDKILKGLKDKLKGMSYKPLQIGDAVKEWERFLAVVDSKLADKIEAPKLGPIEKFNAADLGVKTPAGKTIKFELVNAADLWKKNLEDVFDKDGEEEKLKTMEKQVQVAEEGVAEQAKTNEKLDLLNRNFERFGVVA